MSDELNDEIDRQFGLIGEGFNADVGARLREAFLRGIESGAPAAREAGRRLGEAAAEGIERARDEEEK